MNVVAFAGLSGSGKTTAIAALVEHFVARGKRVGVIKHTHHQINEQHRGDTAEFRRAGAEPVVLAGDREAVVFANSGTRRIRYDEPQQLLSQFDNNDVVFIEGFKSVRAWRRIELTSDQRRTTQELLAILDRIWRP